MDEYFFVQTLGQQDSFLFLARPAVMVRTGAPRPRPSS